MHIDYAAETFLRHTAPKHSAPSTAQQTVAVLAAEKEFLALAEQVGDEKTSSIVTTIRKNASNRFAKVTEAQRFALASALLAKHGSALNVYAAAFGVSAEEFNTTIEGL